MEIGMAAFKLVAEADRLIEWTKKFKPEQTHLTFPNQFGGQAITKLLPRFAKQNDAGHWFYQGYECRFAPLLPEVTRTSPTAGTRDNPHRVTKKVLYDDGKDIAILVSRDGAR